MDYPDFAHTDTERRKRALLEEYNVLRSRIMYEIDIVRHPHYKEIEQKLVNFEKEIEKAFPANSRNAGRKKQIPKNYYSFVCLYYLDVPMDDIISMLKISRSSYYRFKQTADKDHIKDNSNDEQLLLAIGYGGYALYETPYFDKISDIRKTILEKRGYTTT